MLQDFVSVSSWQRKLPMQYPGAIYHLVNRGDPAGRLHNSRTMVKGVSRNHNAFFLASSRRSMEKMRVHLNSGQTSAVKGWGSVERPLDR